MSPGRWKAIVASPSPTSPRTQRWSPANGGRATIPARRWCRWRRRWPKAGLHLGDTVVVNVLGRDIAAKLANLRKVNWRSFASIRAGLFSQRAERRALHRLSRRRCRPRPDAEPKLMRAVAQDSRTSPASGCAKPWTVSERWSQACARHSRATTGPRSPPRSWCSRGRWPPIARAPRRRDDPENPCATRGRRR